MFYVCEFELYDGDGGSVIAVPFGLGAGTFGDSYDNAIESAADYVKCCMEDWLMGYSEPPAQTFGHEPEHGGRMVVMGVSHSLADIDAVTSAEAARRLGVSAARVAQMCDAQLLDSWKDGNRRMVTVASIEARLEEQPKAGRPKVSGQLAEAPGGKRA